MILTPYTPLQLQNRVVMAPMTRCFAPQGIPTNEMADYYAKRGSAGLIIGEATMVGPLASGYPDTPGIYTDEQEMGWRNVCEKVHQQGAKFFLQLWHAGMMSHPHYRKGIQPISASSVIPKGRIVPRTQGQLMYGPSKAMDRQDIHEMIEQFSTSAARAIRAGCDGVELHGANGYLLDNYLHHDTNHRTDEYGQTPENMSRFVLQIVDAVIAKIGADRLGIRLSPVPVPSMNNLEEESRDTQVFIYLLSQLELRNIAYVHVSSDDDRKDTGTLRMPISSFIRTHYLGTLIGCGSYDVDSGTIALAEKKFDLIAFGRLFISNPDLVEKIRHSIEIDPFSGSMLSIL